MSKQKQTLFTFLFTGLAIGWLATANLLAEEPERTWTSADRSERIQARLINYDRQTGWLQLRLANGNSRSISDRKISSGDRRYLGSFLKRQSAEATGDPSGERQRDRRASEKSNGQMNSTDSRYGIDWTPRLSRALQQATATDSRGDDRPVFCFRVLGDLTGPM